MDIKISRPQAYKLTVLMLEKEFGNLKIADKKGRHPMYNRSFFYDDEGLIKMELTKFHKDKLIVNPKIFYRIGEIFVWDDDELAEIFYDFFMRIYKISYDILEPGWGTNLYGIGDNIRNKDEYL